MRNLFEPDYGVRHDWIPAEKPPQSARWTVARVRALIPRVAATGDRVTAERMRAAVAQRQETDVLRVGQEIARILKEFEG
jgi:hypothetical protein